MQEVQAILQTLYPGVGVAGNFREGRNYRSPIARLEKPVTQLGLRPHTVEQSLGDNADSLLTWGLVVPRKGVDNWQREGNDLGIRSKWSPHLYPAVDPEVKKRLIAEGKA